MNIFIALNQLIQKAISKKMIQPEDEIYARNQIMFLLGLTEWEALSEQKLRLELEIPDLLEELVLYAIQEGRIENLQDEKEILSSQIMNILMPKPSEVNRIFYEQRMISPEKATDYFYSLSRNSNYIQTKGMGKNISYKIDTVYGVLDITINLSKPEKDPKEIERERQTVSSAYPKCLLCIENEGYAGRISHPARSNHRLIRMELRKEPWFFQYSPYVYYHEHCIVLSAEHRDMVINRGTFEKLIEFVGKYPHYFLGSNADLPIVGGSILAHDHFQGGNFEFAMARARAEMAFTLKGFPAIKAATIKWPMACIRLRSNSREELAAACDHILQKWKNYSDADAKILAYSDGGRHNTITPICRMWNDEWEIDLVLRNNRTDEDHPLGIFHPHHDVHHIKKENIGLIEVMGLAVLPARLATELMEVENYLLGKKNQIEEYHLFWAMELKKYYQKEISANNVKEIVQKEVGFKFLKALEDASVFKRTKKGQLQFKNFIDVIIHNKRQSHHEMKGDNTNDEAES